MKPVCSRLLTTSPWAAALLGALVLAGCGGETQELQDWMDQQRREVRASVQPLAAPKKFNPVPYANAQQVDPFSAQKLSVALKQEARQPNSMLAAELSRRKEPLESFPLDAMAMVGSVSRSGTPVALLRATGDFLRWIHGKGWRRWVMFRASRW